MCKGSGIAEALDCSSERHEFKSQHCQAATAGPLSKVFNQQLLSCIKEITVSHSRCECLPNAVKINVFRFHLQTVSESTAVLKILTYSMMLCLICIVIHPQVRGVDEPRKQNSGRCRILKVLSVALTFKVESYRVSA